MTDLDILSEMIRESAKIIMEKKNDRNMVRLCEPSCPYSNVSIRGLPESSLIIKADSWPAPDTVFSGSKGECKRADYIIIAEKNKTLVAVYIELKKNSGDTNKEVIKQLLGARCFIDYCQAVGREFWKDRDFLSKIKHRYVYFTHTGSINKKRTQVNREKLKHDRAEEFLKIGWATYVEFNMLA